MRPCQIVQPIVVKKVHVIKQHGNGPYWHNGNGYGNEFNWYGGNGYGNGYYGHNGNAIGRKYFKHRGNGYYKKSRPANIIVVQHRVKYEHDDDDD